MSASAIAANTAFALGANGETANIVNACAAGTMSVSYACDLIRLGRGEIFLAGGTDAFSSLAYAGFNALHALSAGPCSPLNHSNGISLGEGAGVLVVEEYEHAIRRGAKIYCEVAAGASAPMPSTSLRRSRGRGADGRAAPAPWSTPERKRATSATSMPTAPARPRTTRRSSCRCTRFLRARLRPSARRSHDGPLPRRGGRDRSRPQRQGADGEYGPADDGLCPGGSGPAGRKGPETSTAL